MAKRGEKRHMKRIAVSSPMGISNKKEYVWITKPRSGPHDGKHSIPLSVLLRDILKVCKNNREARNILNNGMVSVDGRTRTDEKFPVGFMDIVHLGEEDLYYRIMAGKHGRLVPVSIKKGESNEKIAKVIGKFTTKKGEIRIRLHDGKVLKADNNVKVGDSVVVSIPENRIKKVLRMEKGALCVIKAGKHSGMIATIEEVVATEAGREKEAKMKGEKENFITVMRHLCVVDEKFKGVKE